MALVQPNQKSKAVAMIKGAVGGASSTCRGINVVGLEAALKVLEDLEEPTSSIQDFREKCHKLFPLATAFRDGVHPPPPSSST